MMTGDASVNAKAPIICCTAEILASIALRDGADADVGQVIMDEFHYYSDPDRGWAWQVPLIELPKAQFILMSATLGDVTRFQEDLTRRTGWPTAVVKNSERPVPLIFSFSLEPLHETLQELLTTDQAPVYVVHFTQAAALEQAQALMSTNMSTRQEKDAIAEMIGNFRFASGFGKTLSRLVRHGIGVHHAGMLPKYRRLVETLAQAGLLKVICGTDTLGVGINVPIRTVVFTALAKYDGKKTRLLQAREFHQIAGRAGRAGLRHRRAASSCRPPSTSSRTSGPTPRPSPRPAATPRWRAAGSSRRSRRRGRSPGASPPSSGSSPPSRSRSPRPSPSPTRWCSTSSTGPGNAYQAMKHLLTDNHEDRAKQRKHIHRAIEIYRALLAGGVVERLDEPDEQGRYVRLTVDLQYDFALNQPLSPFALAAIELLDKPYVSGRPPGPRGAYALDVLSVIESTLDDPRQILSAQQFRARGEAVAAMKADGVEYETRMELLEEVTYPKPLEDLLEAAYEIYRRGHPWVGDYAGLPQDRRPRPVRAGHDVPRVRPVLQPVPVRGDRAPLPRRRLQGAAADRARRGQDRGTHRPHRVARRADPPGGLLACRRVGEAQPTRTRRRPSSKAAPKTLTSNTRAFRVLVRNALFRRVTLAALREVRRARRARRGRRLDRRRLGGRPRRRTSSCTTRSAPGPTRAARRC